MSTGPAAPKLNQKDAEVLEFIATSRWITHQQLSEVVQIRGIETNRKVFEWRVRRLAQCGLLKKQRPAFLNRNILYSITRTGIYGLEHIGVHPLSLGADNDDGEIKIKHHIPHSLEINRIRIAMLRSGTLVRWTPGAWIRLLLRAGQKRYAKVYDAVAAVMVHGEIY
ncbi:MAG: hypothetical protein JOZ62_10035, partial [Acidobacteriaceae bacterium]|nr:hypothetical protein [Acidobacteriaceae bacterium]